MDPPAELSSAHRALLVLGLLTLPAVGAHAQELVTDRPDQTESSVVVPAGTVQIESGWLHSEDGEASVDLEADELPGTLARIGLAERLELRLGWAGYVSQDTSGPGGAGGEVDGAADGELGAKVYLWEEKGSRPEAALLVGTSLPVGDDELTSDAFDPSFRLSLSHTLSERVGLGYNVGVAWATREVGGDRSRLSDYLYTVALGFALSERLGAFTELFGEVAGSSPDDARHSFDGGFTYLLGDRLQLDVAGGVGLSSAATDWFVGAGVSVRWPR